MDEREACERLVARYGPRRACTLIGARQLLALYGPDGLVRRGWISQEQLAVVERDLRRAGTPWSPAGEDREATERR